jgi:hypothetical protein
MSAQTTTKLILNSSQRTSGKPECCSFILKQPGIRAEAFEVLKVEIPHSFYNITDANNQIDWEDDTGTSQVSTLTNGNYSTDELLTHISNVMTADTLADTGTATYTASKDANTKKITITNNLLANFEIHWSTNDITQQLARDLGYFETPSAEDRGQPAVVDLTGAATYTANNQYWIGTPKNINIKSNLSGYALKQPAITVLKGGGVFNILDQMLVPTVAGEITVYEPYKSIINKMNSNTIFELNFELLDSEFNKLDLNGREWSIVILLHNVLI